LPLRRAHAGGGGLVSALLRQRRLRGARARALGRCAPRAAVELQPESFFGRGGGQRQQRGQRSVRSVGLSGCGVGAACGGQRRRGRAAVRRGGV
jgi:hypothetical protein